MALELSWFCPDRMLPPCHCSTIGEGLGRPIPMQQKNLEYSLIIGLNGGQYRDLYDEIRKGSRKIGLQCEGAQEWNEKIAQSCAG